MLNEDFFMKILDLNIMWETQSDQIPRGFHFGIFVLKDPFVDFTEQFS